jgi:hypothetical protein
MSQIEEVYHVGTHARERILERCLGMSKPFTDEQMENAEKLFRVSVRYLPHTSQMYLPDYGLEVITGINIEGVKNIITVQKSNFKGHWYDKKPKVVGHKTTKYKDMKEGLDYED